MEEGEVIVNSGTKLLFDYLRDVIYDPANARLDFEKLPEDFRELGKGLQFFAECVMETAALAKALSKGDLSTDLPPRENEIAAPLKALHATLRHLTWQAQQVAMGDYQQRIDFMGDFSAAFNSMVEQLERQRKGLLDEIEKGRCKMQALARSNSFLESITAHVSQWIIVIDRESCEWLFTNRKADSVLCSTDCELQLCQWMRLQARSMRGPAEVYTTEFELPCSSGTHYFTAEVRPLIWHEHNAVAFLLIDISDEKEHLRNLENAAYRDRLTQLHNRHYGMEILNQWLSEKTPFVLCFADIDNLKYVNDRFGHAEGDKYIIRIADILREFSPDAVVCRLGGDEFMLLAKNWTMDAAEEQLEALQDRLISEHKEMGVPYDNRMSYGIIEIDADNLLSAGDLLSLADERMYEHKRAYKARRKNKANIKENASFY